MSFTNYLEDKVLNHVFGGNAYTQPSLYVALFTKGPGEAGGGTEVSGFNYARQSTTMSVAGSAPTEATNDADIAFPAAAGPFGRVTHAGVYDALTGGNLLAWATLTDPADFSTEQASEIQTSDIFKIEAGNLKIRLD
jgi:hypothetical protein